MITKTELKPCPFCGGEALNKKQKGPDYYLVVCDRCMCAGGPAWSIEVAREAWNTRAPLDAPQVESEPVAWANGEQLALCKKMPLYDEPNNPMLHNIPRNIAGQALQSYYCNTPLYDKPQASVTVLPERVDKDGAIDVLGGLYGEIAVQHAATLYNQAMYEVAKLNATPVPIELLRRVTRPAMRLDEMSDLMSALDELRELTK